MTNAQIEKLNLDIIEHTENLENAYSLIKIIDDGIDKFELEVDEMDFSNMKTQIKFHCFLTSSLLDLLSIIKGLLVSDESWQKIFYIKNGYLIIYETVETLNHHNASFKNIIKKEYPLLASEYSGINDSLKKFKKENDYDGYIGKIRNKIAGHFDKDFDVYYEYIISLKSKKNIKAINDFTVIVYDLMKFSFKMAKESEHKTKFNTEIADNNLIDKMNELRNIINNSEILKK